MNDSQTNSSTQYLKTRSKPPFTLQNHVFKTTAVRITTAVRHSATVRPNGSNGHGCSNLSSDEAYKLCNAKETPNSSKSWGDLPANNSITDNHSDRIAFGMADVVKAEARNSTCTMSSLVDEESPHSDHSAEDTATLAESLLDMNGLSSPHWNLLFSASDYSKDFGVENCTGERPWR
jgi:hypothetical protein